ncbi:MAG TPA: hypothetical protein VF698_09210, partial [Thermoanaerobaculia bacterium]
MDRFPEEFSDLLNARGRKVIAAPPRLPVMTARGRTPIALLEGLIDDGVARDCIRLLDAALYPVLRRMHTPIPREALTEMTDNFGELLPKTVRVKTMTLNSRGTKALGAAREVGLAQMMRSKSFHRFAEALVGRTLRADHWGRQVICYEQGDYSGPHNDHHPQREEAKNGFVDLHIMFSNDAVATQQLVYEENGYLSAAHEVGGRSGVAIYKLPFWHYTTPLVARRGREREARRWLLL